MDANDIKVTKHEGNHNFKNFFLPKKFISMKRTYKFNKTSMVRIIAWETKREGQRKAKIHIAHKNQKKMGKS
jgi:hypothetical protein